MTPHEYHCQSSRHCLSCYTLICIFPPFFFWNSALLLGPNMPPPGDKPTTPWPWYLQDTCAWNGWMGQLAPRMPPPHSPSHPPQHTNTSFRSPLNQPLKYSQPTSQIPQRTPQISQPISQISHTQPLKSSLNRPIKSFSQPLHFSSFTHKQPNKQTNQTIRQQKPTRRV